MSIERVEMPFWEVARLSEKMAVLERAIVDEVGQSVAPCVLFIIERVSLFI